jgi:hypothetical protein
MIPSDNPGLGLLAEATRETVLAGREIPPAGPFKDQIVSCVWRGDERLHAAECRGIDDRCAAVAVVRRHES